MLQYLTEWLDEYIKSRFSFLSCSFMWLYAYLVESIVTVYIHAYMRIHTDVYVSISVC